MNDIIFYKSFKFNEFNYNREVRCDNSHGVELHYIGYMKHGSGRIVTEGEEMRISAGEMFYIPKGCKYRSFWMPEGDCVRFDSIGFLYFPTPTPNGYRLQKIERGERVMRAFAPLSESKEHSLASISALYSLLDILKDTMAEAPPDRETALYEDFRGHLRRDPRLTVPEYASLCGVSEALLYARVKEYSGKTPNELRREELCRRATELLRTTDRTVEDICDRLGFSSSNYFRKVFFEIYGKTPSQVRRERNTM